MNALESEGHLLCAIGERASCSVDRGGSARLRRYGMPSGTIARLLIDKGFGFIRDEAGVEHFFHRSSVRSAVFELLREGQRVEFTEEQSDKGPRAGEVRLLEG